MFTFYSSVDVWNILGKILVYPLKEVRKRYDIKKHKNYDNLIKLNCVYIFCSLTDKLTDPDKVSLILDAHCYRKCSF